MNPTAAIDRRSRVRHGLRPGNGVAAVFLAAVRCLAATACALGQQPPYDDRPAVEPPYHRVRYEASTDAGGLIFPATFTAWIPAEVPRLRGVVVHQHGCGEGSCRSGFTAAFDLHWQALARKHACALVAPVYEQPEKADCQKWCDPRNGSGDAFTRAMADLGRVAGRPEMATVPWALWGHSGGAHWAGGMAILHPDRVVAAWLRSGVPLFEADPDRPDIEPHALPEAVLRVPMLCNPGTQEGVTVTDGRFKAVWPATKSFFTAIRSRGGLVAVAIDPLTAHECGNQRYLAIPWLDACLAARLPRDAGGDADAVDRLRPLDAARGWLAPIEGGRAIPAAEHSGDPLAAGWLPGEVVAKAWMEYVADTRVADATPPPPPANVRAVGNEVSWDATADPESGLAGFVIERDGRRLAEPVGGVNPFGRPLFQGLQYSDTPVSPLVPFRFVDDVAAAGEPRRYRVIARNTVGLESPPSEPAVVDSRP